MEARQWIASEESSESKENAIGYVTFFILFLY